MVRFSGGGGSSRFSGGGGSSLSACTSAATLLCSSAPRCSAPAGGEVVVAAERAAPAARVVAAGTAAAARRRNSSSGAAAAKVVTRTNSSSGAATIAPRELLRCSPRSLRSLRFATVCAVKLSLRHSTDLARDRLEYSSRDSCKLHLKLAQIRCCVCRCVIKGYTRFYTLGAAILLRLLKRSFSAS